MYLYLYLICSCICICICIRICICPSICFRLYGNLFRNLSHDWSGNRYKDIFGYHRGWSRDNSAAIALMTYAIDAEDVPVPHHAIESSRLRSARAYCHTRRAGHDGDARGTSMESKRPRKFRRQARAGKAERPQGQGPRSLSARNSTPSLTARALEDPAPPYSVEEQPTLRVLKSSQSLGP